jgi:hypothetical protein
VAQQDGFEEGFDEGFAVVVEAGDGFELEPQVVVGAAFGLVEDERVGAY